MNNSIDYISRNLNTLFMRERKDVYKLPAGDKTLEWYGKAVAEMRKRPATDPTSWWYQAGIHGYNGMPIYWGEAGTLPPPSERAEFWDRCQHQSWFFLPWHRMYLAYFEQIVAQTVADLGGPADWSLPFWNYSDKTNPNRLNIPPAFTSPNGKGNPLWMPGRNNTVAASDTELTRLGITYYTARGAGYPGFGGPETDFHHGGGQSGGLEDLPHNRIHSDIGGAMGIVAAAALDPIFWLHHANIDRLWQVWLNEQGGRQNPSESKWLDFSFKFHDKNKSVVTMTPSGVEDTRTVLTGYVYQGVPATTPTQKIMENFATERMIKPLDIIGATEKAHVIGEGTTRMSLSLLSQSKKQKLMTEAVHESAESPVHTVLKLENIQGKGAAPIYNIYLNASGDVQEDDDHLAGSVSLFGMENSSTASTHSSGSGLNLEIEVTDLMNKLRSMPNWNDDQLEVSMVPRRAKEKDVEISIGKISLYSE